jgi:hypothetical protein
MDTAVAPEIVQDNVLDPPWVREEGVAVKLLMVGLLAGGVTLKVVKVKSVVTAVKLLLSLLLTRK